MYNTDYCIGCDIIGESDTGPAFYLSTGLYNAKE